MPRDLADHVIIITGASSGIGAATALACARAGMNVVINARREERLRELAQHINGLGRKAEVVAGDVTEPGISERMLDLAERVFGRFDAVFANAGYGVEGPVHETSEADLREIFNVNFFAAVDLLQAAAKRLLASKRSGHLLMCSSCLARFSLPLSAAYCATKAAQCQICRSMRIELAPHRIEVSSVHPVGTATEFFDASAARTGKAVKPPPRMIMQPPARVANAVVKCLRRPKPEVWTSFFVRFNAGLMTISPRYADFAMRMILRYS